MVGWELLLKEESTGRSGKMWLGCLAKKHSVSCVSPCMLPGK